MTRRLVCGLACLVGLVLGPSVSGSEQIWTGVESEKSAAECLRASAIRYGHVVELAPHRLAAVLSELRSDEADGSVRPPVIDLPLPDGSYGRFSLEQSTVMAPGLAIRFPGIRTFVGIGLDDPGAVARFDLTLKGFHGMILSAGEVVYINPIACGEENLYVSFNVADTRRSEATRFECGIRGEAPGHRIERPKSATGPQLRTYRTAIAATGEYTQYHGGTKAQALSAMVVVVNRLNGIFIRDLSLVLELVADNDRVIFLDPDTDPYTFDDTAIMIGENQLVLDNLIGSFNYDHGHVFNTHPGGRAGDFGTTCDPTFKGQGVSGLRAPAGEVFMIDLVAHEMGHQFGAAHTYNSLERVCSIARHEWAAYEPGSGSTIMSYAGVCGVEDITEHSDDYFHGFSLEEIGAYVTTFGSVCGSVISTGNAPPLVSAGPDFDIPSRTPFILDGSGSDASPLTFTWEQLDLGPSSPPMEDDGARPLFRSFPPTSVPRRFVPRLEDVLAGSSTLGEALPTTTRSLTFRLTARDGFGGVDHDTVVLRVDGTAGPFVVTSPRAGDRWEAGGSAIVHWDVAGTMSPPVACEEVDILLSENDGADFATTLVQATPNDGGEEVDIPLAGSTQARVMVVCSDNRFFAVSPRFDVVWWRPREATGRRTP